MMSARGLTQSGRERLHRVLSGHVERQEVPGLVAIVSRHDDVHVEVLGTLAAGDPQPMPRDAIFRIASLTKPIVAAAAMMLVEECRLRLDASIEPWIPELANRRVLKSISSPIDHTVPANRAITVRDLLTYRMGFGSVMAPPDTYPIQKLVREYKIGGDGPPLPAQAPTTEQWLNSLASLPWLAQPGEQWLYNTSGDVLGILVARVARQPLGEFLRERLFAPLGMKDTAFHVPGDKRARLPNSYRFDAQARALRLYDRAQDSAWGAPPPIESGAGGLVGTIDDYLAFSRMMLDHGRHGDRQLLSRASIALMTSDQLTPEQRAGSSIFFGAHCSWGFGMSVDIHRDQLFRSPGRFGWDGGLGTSAYVDPVEQLIGILFSQRMMDSPEPPAVFNDFWTTAYAAMD